MTARSLFPNGQATQDQQGHKWAAMVIKAHHWNNIFTMDLDLTFNILPISPYVQQKKLDWYNMHKIYLSMKSCEAL